MSAYSMGGMLCQGQMKVSELCAFVKNNGEAMHEYEMEQSIFSRIRGIGLAAMKRHFAEKGSGDIGDVFELEDGRTLKKERV